MFSPTMTAKINVNVNYSKLITWKKTVLLHVCLLHVCLSHAKSNHQYARILNKFDVAMYMLNYKFVTADLNEKIVLHWLSGYEV